MRLSRVPITAAATVGVAALLLAGCSRAGGSAPSSASTSASAPSSSAAASGASFGTLSDVCHGGSASGATDQGVTSGSVKVGVLSDYGYTKDDDLLNAAKVFTSWCNAHGGIDGRKVVADIHDTELHVRRQRDDQRVRVGLRAGRRLGRARRAGYRRAAEVPAARLQRAARHAAKPGVGAGAVPYTSNFSYAAYAGYYKWLFQKYPDSADHFGILYGQSIVTQYDSGAAQQTVKADGGVLSYSESFPPVGVSNWTPYAEAIKAKGVKGLVFDDTIQDLVALEQALDNLGYHLDWIDANSNAYGAAFIQIAGKALTGQNNYADLAGIWPLEKSATDPAEQQLTALFQQYAPGQPVSLQVLQAFSMWLQFAVSAESCGAALTRACVYGAAVKQTAWTGGGLTAPVNESQPLGPPGCFDIEQATTSGWSRPPGSPRTPAAPTTAARPPSS